jgi:arginyl-tRNA synthetase
MERIYKRISLQCDEKKPEFDAATRDRARQELVKLQNGDPENLGIWQEMIRLSRAHFDAIYQRLGVSFDHTLGESFYNPRLRAVVQELLDRRLARESEGAVCVFSDGSVPPKEDPFLIFRDGAWHANPCLIQKSDGAFNYATTDLATLAHRFETWNPDEIIYVTDDRQQEHFRKLFAICRAWHPASKVRLAHIWFGKILGDDGKPIKTRSGETPRLAGVLDEAEAEAFRVVTEKNADLPEPTRREIARVVGLGAVKYFDLLPNRQSDYQLSFEPSSPNYIWKKLLSLQGNTAPYLQYAYTRIRSIFRKGAPDGASAPPGTSIGPAPLILRAAEEVTLAKQLLHFGLVLETVADDYRPNYLCNYLYDLAGHFARFYERCPVLKAEPALQQSRLRLCDLTAGVLRQGLHVLGIETLEQM